MGEGGRYVFRVCVCVSEREGRREGGREGGRERKPLTIRGVGLEYCHRLLVLSEIPEADRPISPTNSNKMRLMWTPVQALQCV